MTHDEMIEVIRAHRDGKKLEERHKNGPWRDKEDDGWFFNVVDYRVKPEPREWWIEHGHCQVGFAHKSAAPGCIHVREVLP